MAEYTFTWPSGPKEVIVTGDFDHWEGSLSLVKQSEGDFAITIPLAKITDPGDNFYFKFIVDGEWQTSNQYAKDRASGPENNYISLSEFKKSEAIEVMIPKTEGDLVIGSNSSQGSYNFGELKANAELEPGPEDKANREIIKEGEVGEDFSYSEEKEDCSFTDQQSGTLDPRSRDGHKTPVFAAGGENGILGIQVAGSSNDSFQQLDITGVKFDSSASDTDSLLISPFVVSTKQFEDKFPKKLNKDTVSESEEKGIKSEQDSLHSSNPFFDSIYFRFSNDDPTYKVSSPEIAEKCTLKMTDKPKNVDSNEETVFLVNGNGIEEDEHLKSNDISILKDNISTGPVSLLSLGEKESLNEVFNSVTQDKAVKDSTFCSKKSSVLTGISQQQEPLENPSEITGFISSDQVSSSRNSGMPLVEYFTTFVDNEHLKPLSIITCDGQEYSKKSLTPSIFNESDHIFTSSAESNKIESADHYSFQKERPLSKAKNDEPAKDNSSVSDQKNSEFEIINEPNLVSGDSMVSEDIFFGDLKQKSASQQAKHKYVITTQDSFNVHTISRSHSIMGLTTLDPKFSSDLSLFSKSFQNHDSSINMNSDTFIPIDFDSGINQKAFSIKLNSHERSTSSSLDIGLGISNNTLFGSSKNVPGYSDIIRKLETTNYYSPTKCEKESEDSTSGGEMRNQDIKRSIEGVSIEGITQMSGLDMNMEEKEVNTIVKRSTSPSIPAMQASSINPTIGSFPYQPTLTEATLDNLSFVHTSLDENFNDFYKCQDFSDQHSTFKECSNQSNDALEKPLGDNYSDQELELPKLVLSPLSISKRVHPDMVAFNELNTLEKMASLEVAASVKSSNKSCETFESFLPTNRVFVDEACADSINQLPFLKTNLSPAPGSNEILQKLDVSSKISTSSSLEKSVNIEKLTADDIPSQVEQISLSVIPSTSFTKNEIKITKCDQDVASANSADPITICGMQDRGDAISSQTKVTRTDGSTCTANKTNQAPPKSRELTAEKSRQLSSKDFDKRSISIISVKNSSEFSARPPSRTVLVSDKGNEKKRVSFFFKLKKLLK